MEVQGHQCSQSPWSQQLLAHQRKGEDGKFRLKSAEPWGHGGHQWGMSIQIYPALHSGSLKSGAVLGSSESIAGDGNPENR